MGSGFSHRPLWKFREGRGRRRSLSIRKILWVSAALSRFLSSIVSPLFFTFSLSQRLPSLPLLYGLYDQLLWGCSNPRDLSYRGRQGPGGAEKREVPCIIGQHLGDTWPFSGRGSQFQSLIGSVRRGRDLAPGLCFLAVSTHITWETADNADPQFLPRTTVRVHLMLPKHSATDR